MAILGLDSLTGCNSIPDFIASGTRMIFNGTSAPTSWTKDTTSHNNKALRIVTGTVSSGGTNPFIAVFPDTQKAVQVQAGSGGDAQTVQPATISLSLTQTTVNVNSIARTSDGNTLATHGHSGVRFPGDAQPGPVGPPTNKPVVARGLSDLSVNNNGASPVNAQHNHSFPGATSQHSHTTNNAAHTHPVIASSAHVHTVTVASQDFAVSYYDVIIASKN
jgi:hypothetical protein